MKEKCCLGTKLYTILAGILLILIGIDYYAGIVPGLKTVTASTAIIVIIVGAIGIVLVFIDKCCCKTSFNKDTDKTS